MKGLSARVCYEISDPRIYKMKKTLVETSTILSLAYLVQKIRKIGLVSGCVSR